MSLFVAFVHVILVWFFLVDYVHIARLYFFVVKKIRRMYLVS